jgi:hypothetical protein
MSVPRKQSFCTSLDTSFILLCYTLLYFPTVFSELFSKTTVTLLYGVISVPSSQYCTSLCYHVVLLAVIMLYLCPSQYCTSLCYHIVFSIMTFFYAKLQGVVYFPKLSIRTFGSYCCVLPVITIFSFRFHHHSIILPSIIFFYFLLLSCCTSFYHNIVLHFIIILYYICHNDLFFIYSILLCYTCLYFSTIFQELFSKIMVSLLYGVLSVPLSQYCTSPLCYHILYYPCLMLYFPPP